MSSPGPQVSENLVETDIVAASSSGSNVSVGSEEFGGVSSGEAINGCMALRLQLSIEKEKTKQAQEKTKQVEAIERTKQLKIEALLKI